MKSIRVGVIGLGVVGQGLIKGLMKIRIRSLKLRASQRRISKKHCYGVWRYPLFTKYQTLIERESRIGTREQGGFICEILPHYVQLIHHFFGNVKISYSQV